MLEGENDNMNTQPPEYKKNKKYTVKSIKTEEYEDYSETNKRTREEFAKGLLQAYGGAWKKIMRGERPGRDARDFIMELKKEMAEEDDENE